jgi:serine/threonine protein kinase
MRSGVPESEGPRESASALPSSGEASSSFLILLKHALGDRQHLLREIEDDQGPHAEILREIEDDQGPHAEIQTAERIGRFEVIEVLGRGGYGTVLRVRDLKLGCERALKLPNPETLASARSLTRFMDEARKAARIDHPNVVRVVEADEVFSLHYMVMEYCPGGSLAGWLARRPVDRPIPPKWAAALVAEIADGVQQAHAAGLLHRDLKPGNVMLVRVDDRNEADPPRFHPKVGDFGLAKALGESPGPMDRTVSGTMIGTLAYMSPEQARGDKSIGAAADIYGIGAILYEVVTRSTPYPAASEAELLGRILDDSPPVSARALRPDLPRDLDTICRTALAKRPGDRYATAAELADDLRRFLRNDPVKGSPWRKRAWATLRRYRSRVAVAAVALTVIAASATAWFHDRELKRRNEVEMLLTNLESATVARFPELVPKVDPTDAEVAYRLKRLFTSGTENQKLAAALVLASADREYAEFCYDRLLKAKPDELVPIARLLSEREKDLVSRLAEVLEEAPKPGQPSDEEQDRRRANAACVLIALRGDERGWSLLRFVADPQARSFLIATLGPAGVAPESLVARLKDPRTSCSSRRALIQSIGDVPRLAWPPDLYASVVKSLPAVYRDDPDAGVHGAAKWLLLQWGLGAEIKRIDDELARNPNVAPGFQWRISREGLTLITVDDRTLDRVFEVSDTEITVEFYQGFDRNVDYSPEISPERACPINGVSYYEAAAFCNWLSSCEGLPEREACYEPMKAGVDIEGTAYQPVPGYRERGGFRLPDNTEFAAFCAAGTTTSRYCGDSDILIGRYAWTWTNKTSKAHPVAGRLPNDLGLFDTLGNLTEWCERAAPVKSSRGVRVDLRGGWFGHIASAGLSRSTVV